MGDGSYDAESINRCMKALRIKSDFSFSGVGSRFIMIYDAEAANLYRAEKRQERKTNGVPPALHTDRASDEVSRLSVSADIYSIYSLFRIKHRVS